MAAIRKHGFLTQGHNAWFFWSCEGNQSLTNPGPSHRALESLSYVLDLLAMEGWQISKIFIDQQGTPNLVSLYNIVESDE